MWLYKLQRIVGLAGVSKHENGKAQSVGRFFEYCMLLLIVLFALQWHIEQNNPTGHFYANLINWVVWGFFLVETSILTYLVDDKKHYLKTNWMNLVLISTVVLLLLHYTPFVMLLRVVRFVIIALILIPTLVIFVRWLSDTSLLTTLAAYFVIVILFGLLGSIVDPALKTPHDGIWWALVSMSTLGYGDIVPVSTVGKILTALLLILGLGFLAVFTANFSALFVQRSIRDDLELIHKSNNKLSEVMKTYDKILEEEKKILTNIDDAREEEFRILLSLQTVKEEEETIISILTELHGKIDTLIQKVDAK